MNDDPITTSWLAGLREVAAQGDPNEDPAWDEVRRLLTIIDSQEADLALLMDMASTAVLLALRARNLTSEMLGWEFFNIFWTLMLHLAQFPPELRKRIDNLPMQPGYSERINAIIKKGVPS